MSETVHDLLSRDHVRLDGLLEAALRPDGGIDAQAYAAFRSGLLRHIGIEERVLFAELRRQSEFSDLERQLHRDHAAMAALLALAPAKREIELIRQILSDHNPLEEEAEGLYYRVVNLPESNASRLIERIREFPQVPVAPYSDSPALRRSIDQLVQLAAEGRKRLGGMPGSGVR
ncbi:MAG: hemerythrin domain-containing protein [Acidobacteriota bacterium]